MGILVVAYLILVLVVSFHFNISLTPDRVILLLLLAGLATGRVRQFLRDWSIFLVVLLAWQLLSGMSHNLGIQPHVQEMISFDRWLFFGTLPTTWLQEHFYHPGHYAAYNMLLHHPVWVPGRLEWYDVAATTLYLMHFVFPMLVAFALWHWTRPIFIEFMGSFAVVALAGFATFALFPAAPPWIAGNWFHVIPHVYRVLDAGMNFFGGTASFSTLYQWMWQHGGWDVYGAMPSEHAAFPFLCFLYARKAWPRVGWLLLPYCVAVWIAVVYMGEHYVADVVAGIAYASVGYIAIQIWQARRKAAAVQLTARQAVTDTLTA